jgi:hypothetical protein
MKKYLLTIILGLTILGCNKEEFQINPNVRVQGLSLYWDHEVFGEEGRRLRFEFYENKPFENTFDLVFKYKIKDNEIIVVLVDKVNKGKCPQFPGWSDLCTPKGGFSIPDKLLTEKNYTLTLKTFDFEIKSNLLIDDEKYTLAIPSNVNFSSSIKYVYPIPKNLLFGSVVFTGNTNMEAAKAYFEDLKKLGLTEATIPNLPYRNLNVGEDGKTVNEQWDPDNYKMGLLFNMEIDFKRVFELSKEHFNKTNLNIFLFSSKGDQARLSKNEGITVVYGN